MKLYSLERELNFLEICIKFSSWYILNNCLLLFLFILVCPDRYAQIHVSPLSWCSRYKQRDQLQNNLVQNAKTYMSQ